MHKLLLTCTVAAVLALAGTASADTYEGDILIGHPVTVVIGGATENAFPCDTESDLNGLDGVWFDISADDGTRFALTMDATLDADVWFYNADCGYISDTVGAAQGLGADEFGAVPSGAAFAVVDGAAGTGSFALTLS